MAHPELGSRILDQVLEQVGTAGKVETQARLEGRNMTMVIAPEKKALPPKKHSEAKAAPEPEAVKAPPADVAPEPVAEVEEVKAAPAEATPEPAADSDPA
jgi:translation initiation factor IF-3